MILMAMFYIQFRVYILGEQHMYLPTLLGASRETLKRLSFILHLRDIMRCELIVRWALL